MTNADPLGVLRRRTSEKWATHPSDVLPMFVAEMDFPLAPPIKTALYDAVDLGDTGYVDPQDTRAAVAFAEFAERRWGWAPEPGRMASTTDVSVVIVESLRRLIVPGDGVIITPPVYPPFYDLVREAGGTVVEVPLLDDGATWSLDLTSIDRALGEGARVVLLCSPQNPVGLIHSRTTLQALSEIVARHDAAVVADEIHAPLCHTDHSFTPYLSVSPESRQHAIVATSASKAFNLAGLKAAFFITASDRMTDLIRELPEEVLFRTGLFGLIATRAAFESGSRWLDATLATIEENFTLLEHLLEERLPTIRLRRPHATYLAWLDMSDAGWGEDPAGHLLTHARVALSNGPRFGSPGAGHARMNVACAPQTIVEAVDRIARLCRM